MMNDATCPTEDRCETMQPDAADAPESTAAAATGDDTAPASADKTPADDAGSFWSRPAGMREALFTAVPLMISSLSWTVMNFIDRLFLLKYSPEQLGASLPAGILSFASIAFPLGIASYVSTFVAQYFGANRHRQIGPIVWQAVWIGIVATPLALAVLPISPWVFSKMERPELAGPAVDYFFTLSFSGGAIVLAGALSGFFNGLGRVWTVMIVDTIAAAINVLLDYAWIFGKWGFPEAGIIGAGWATTSALWCKVLIYFVLFLRAKNRREFGTLSGWRPDLSQLRRLSAFGFAGGSQMALEVAAFGTFTLLVGKLGSEALSATSIAFNVNNFAFMPVWGIGIAASTMVGRRLGEDRPQLAERSTWSCLWLAMLYMAVLCVLYGGFPHWVLAGHAKDIAKLPGLRETTITLLLFVASFNLFDAANIIFAGALKGAGDVLFVMIASVGIALAGVTTTWIGIEYYGGGLYWCWWVLTAWVVALSAAFLVRFRRGRWKAMRVIEPEIE
jgi:MATE family multidrug resistance protein